MDKKSLKNFINENGFFFHIDEIERIEKNDITYSKNAIKTKAALPEGENIITFRGRATQEFERGETSRNGYKISVKGWDWKNYLKNPIILWQHWSDEPIGKTLEINPQQDGVEILYYVDLKSLSEQNAHRIESGLVPMLSTGHITKEVKFENKDTGELVDEDDFWDLPFSERQNYNMVVTKAEAVEISAVTIGSNPDALTTKNSLELLFNKLSMKHKDKASGEEVKKNEEEETTQTTEETPENGESGNNEEKPSEETQTEETSEENTEVEEGGEKSEESTEAEPENGEGAEEVAEEGGAEGENASKEIKKNNPKTAPVDPRITKAVEALVNIINEQGKEINQLKETISKLPGKKPLVAGNQFNTEKKVEKNDKKSRGEAVVNFLKGSGFIR